MKRLLCLLFAGSVLAGCGARDESVDSQPFVTQAPPVGSRSPELREATRNFNTICSATENAIERAERQEFPGDDQPTTAQLQRFVEEVEVPTRRAAVESMRRIEVPATAAETVTGYVDAYELAVVELGAQLAVIRTVGIRETVLDNAERLADRAGLARCGTGALVEGRSGREIPSGLEPG